MAARRTTSTLTRVMVTALFFLSGYVPRRLRADVGVPERAARKRRTTVRFTRSR